MDLFDCVFQEDVADLAIRDLAVLDVAIRRVRESDDLAAASLRVAQAVQCSDDSELAFGSAPPSSS